MPNFDNFMKNSKKKLKKMIRKGIPDSLRGFIWMKISGAQKLREGRELYDELKKGINENEFIKIPDEQAIIKDLHRTFPKNVIFNNQLGEGQRQLFRILSCISLRNRRVGYAQGMSFIVAIFLSYLSEEKAFWMMETLMKNFKLKEICCIGFPGLKKNLFVLLKLMHKLLPNLYQKFKKSELYPTIYASSWYLACFTNYLPYEYVIRIFDCYLYEGPKIIHRISLGLLALKENDFLKKTDKLLELMDVMKTVGENIDFDLLFKKSFSFSISRKKITEYENLYKEHESNKKPGDEEFMVQVKM